MRSAFMWVLLLAACGAPARSVTTVETAPPAAVQCRAGDLVYTLASQDTAADILGARDEFIAAMSPVDRSLRLATDREVSEDELLAFTRAQAMEWGTAEARSACAAVERLGAELARTGIRVPGVEQITLVTTTGREEGDAPHTRGDAIVLPASVLDRPAHSLAGLIAHETFHVMTRRLRTVDPAAIDALYAVLDFQPVGAIELPPELAALCVTNPDAIEERRHAIEVTLADGRTARVVPVLHASGPYDVRAGGPFFAYVRLALLEVEERDGRWRSGAVHDPARTSYLSLAARNTDYAIHPEEVLADNFALLVFEGAPESSPVVEPAILRGLAAALVQIAAR